MSHRMEHAASKIMGKAKAGKARIKGLKGIFKTLTEEHGQVSSLLKRVAKTKDIDTRADLFPEIKRELLAHERGELSELYPLLRTHASTREIADEHDREAGELETLLEELDQHGYESAQWKQTFDRLVDMVEHHTSEEESEYFPRAQEVLGDERAKQLEERYLHKKESVMREMGGDEE